MEQTSSRDQAIAASTRWFDDGHFLNELDRRVGYRTESQEAGRLPQLTAYLTDEIGPSIERLGLSWRVLDNPVAGYGPFLIGERIEGPGLPTVLSYGHGDVVRGYDEQWRQGLQPWKITVEGERWYGRGTADNKGQHSINLAALARVIETRGRLGFNIKLLIETGEETGSPGLRAICAENKEALAADVLIGSDGPRLKAEIPTLFLGTRGAFNFDLSVDLREGGHHSGNWGGLLANPGTILANAIASMVDPRGRILVERLRPPPIPNSVRKALAGVEPGEPSGPAIDLDWGEPDQTPAERVFAWNALEVLAYRTGNPDRPVNAIPPSASAHMQLRFVVGSDWQNFIPIIRAHLDSSGFPMVEAKSARVEMMPATRLDPEHPWVVWAASSIARTTGKTPTILPNLGGSLPNDCFAETLGLPTVWIPHSYAACSQHAPDEHLLAPLVREGLQMMTGLFWDLGEVGAELPGRSP